MTHQLSLPFRKVAIAVGLVLVCVVAIAAPGRAATSGQNGLHDPSRMIPSDGKVHVYSTGGGSISSSDGLVWASSTRPPWNPGLLPNNDGVWAPDGLFLNGQYFIYYAMWSDGNKSSAVALLTTPSLDPTLAKWTDRGVAVPGPGGVTHSVIDPGPVLDASGNLWVVWGGGYPFNSTANSIFVTRMDNSTGLPLTTDPGWKPPNSPGYAIEQGHKEGPAIYYHSGYYYLFWQTGNAFNPNTGYQINMARATAISGPYSGDRVFYSKNPAPGIYGPGHMGIYSCGGVERFTYHFYSNNSNSGSALGENALTWGSDGWPVAGAVSTTPLTACAEATGSGGAIGSGTGGASGTGGGGGATDPGGVTGQGGNDAPGGTGGTDSSSGGVTGAGGSGAPGGAGDFPGTGGNGPGTAGTGTAGTSASGTGGSSPGSGGSAGAIDTSSSGCSCDVRGGHGQNGTAGIFLLVGVALQAAARRTRRRHRED